MRPTAVPLFAQLATSLRYEIASGRRSGGAALPSVRAAAAQWQVSIATVRAAYRALADEGLVDLTDRRVALVLARAETIPTPATLSAFSAWAFAEAQRRFSATPDALLNAMQSVRPDADASPLLVVECTTTMAERLAAQLRDTLAVRARGCTIKELASAPRGAVVGTYHHHREILSATDGWPFPPTFLPVAIDPACVREVEGKASTSVVVCGPRRPTLIAMANDLRRALGGSVRVLMSCTDAPEATLSQMPPTVPIVFTPSNWEALSDAARCLPNAIEHRSAFTHDGTRDLQRAPWLPQYATAAWTLASS